MRDLAGIGCQPVRFSQVNGIGAEGWNDPFFRF